MDDVEAVKVVEVLKEHVAFLRGMLAEGRPWYEESLNRLKEDNNALKLQVHELRADRDRARVALAQAVREVIAHNCHTDYTTLVEEVDKWSSLLDF